MATTPAFVGQTGGRFAQVAAARLLSRSGRRAAPCAGNRGYVAPAFHAPAAARARPRRQPGARLVYSRTPTMGLEKVKLGSSDLEVTQVCLGTMTFGIQNSEEEAYVFVVVFARYMSGPHELGLLSHAVFCISLIAAFCSMAVVYGS